jgi:hypothetical protein
MTKKQYSTRRVTLGTVKKFMVGEQFSMDFGSSPIGVFLGQAYDQFPEFLSSSRSTAARSPAPEEAKAGTVPSDDRFWFDYQQDGGPAWPKAAENGPEQRAAVRYGTCLAPETDTT